jgi:hypothetical protein
VRLNHLKEFQDHRCDTAEMSGTKPTAEMIRQVTHIDSTFEMLRIDFSDRRRKYDIDVPLTAHVEIRLERSGIRREIVRAIELQRVDEDADNDNVAFAPSELDKLAMTRVQRSHRRDQPHRTRDR